MRCQSAQLTPYNFQLYKPLRHLRVAFLLELIMQFKVYMPLISAWVTISQADGKAWVSYYKAQGYEVLQVNQSNARYYA